MKIVVKEVGVGIPVLEYATNKIIPTLPALDTKGNKLPVGEYEVELVWHVLIGENKWAKISDPNDYIPATTRQVYICSSVAHDTNILHTDMTGVPLSPVDDYYKELGKRMIDEAKVKEPAALSVNKQPEKDEMGDSQKVIGDTSFVKLKDDAIQIVTKNGCIELYPDEIKELSAFIQPEKEVDTIEQAANYTKEEIETAASAVRFIDDNKGINLVPFDFYIAGTKYIKASHVPIEEVLKIIDKINKLKNPSSHPAINVMAQFCITQIRNLIKPQ